MELPSAAPLARFISVVACCSLLVAFCCPSCTHAQSVPKHQFPAFFIFGDSLADVGNNNYITSLARANQLPFGIDFPEGPTGRFCNGKIVLDVISEFIQLPYAPPYLAPTTRGNALLQGVNYGSAAGGILRSSGFNFVGRVDFDTQITWFGNTIQELQQLLGVSAAKDLIANSLYATVFGSNDYLNNYLLSYSPISKIYTPDQYQDVILNKTAGQLTQLYNMGARNIIVAGVGPLGCIPAILVREKSVNGECSEFVNKLCSDFNAGLQALLQQLNAQLPGTKFLYFDTFNPVFEYRSNPEKYGFQIGTTGCCGAGKYHGQVICLSFLKPCPDRSVYVFWDAYHPTQRTNILLASTLYQSGLISGFFSGP